MLINCNSKNAEGSANPVHCQARICSGLFRINSSTVTLRDHRTFRTGALTGIGVLMGHGQLLVYFYGLLI